ncbi:hypothetical protein DPMN_194198 [Dreissena polymorpha]|uniref:Uncharacterized protein n=1 Tax=Dreissena polymorpha TaxID=45954 RepID=A0A9D3XZX6_DREPO|nr:hypothetical protein DPMN_194198 [Dreissena polymorpha]
MMTQFVLMLVSMLTLLVYHVNTVGNQSDTVTMVTQFMVTMVTVGYHIGTVVSNHWITVDNQCVTVGNYGDTVGYHVYTVLGNHGDTVDYHKHLVTMVTQLVTIVKQLVSMVIQLVTMLTLLVTMLKQLLVFQCEDGGDGEDDDDSVGTQEYDDLEAIQQAEQMGGDDTQHSTR